MDERVKEAFNRAVNDGAGNVILPRDDYMLIHSHAVTAEEELAKLRKHGLYWERIGELERQVMNLQGTIDGLRRRARKDNEAVEHYIASEAEGRERYVDVLETVERQALEILHLNQVIENLRGQGTDDMDRNNKTLIQPNGEPCRSGIPNTVERQSLRA